MRFVFSSGIPSASDSDAADSLEKLAPKNAIPALLRTAKQDLRAYNVYNVGHLVAKLRSPIEADFVLVYAPDSTRNAQAIEVISGMYQAGLAALKERLR